MKKFFIIGILGLLLCSVSVNTQGYYNAAPLWQIPEKETWNTAIPGNTFWSKLPVLTQTSNYTPNEAVWSAFSNSENTFWSKPASIPAQTSQNYSVQDLVNMPSNDFRNIAGAIGCRNPDSSMSNVTLAGYIRGGYTSDQIVQMESSLAQGYYSGNPFLNSGNSRFDTAVTIADALSSAPSLANPAKNWNTIMDTVSFMGDIHDLGTQYAGIPGRLPNLGYGLISGGSMVSNIVTKNPVGSFTSGYGVGRNLIDPYIITPIGSKIYEGIAQSQISGRIADVYSMINKNWDLVVGNDINQSPYIQTLQQQNPLVADLFQQMIRIDQMNNLLPTPTPNSTPQTAMPKPEPTPTPTSPQSAYVQPVYGCTDYRAVNFNFKATVNDGSCDYGDVYGCTDPRADNFNPKATVDDGSCDYGDVKGCTDPHAENFNPKATIDDGSCNPPSAAGEWTFHWDPIVGTGGSVKQQYTGQPMLLNKDGTVSKGKYMTAWGTWEQKGTTVILGGGEKMTSYSDSCGSYSCIRQDDHYGTFEIPTGWKAAVGELHITENPVSPDRVKQADGSFQCECVSSKSQTWVRPFSMER